jgi:hypothetical protein
MKPFRQYLVIPILLAQIYGPGGYSIIVNNPKGGVSWFKGVPCQGLPTTQRTALATTITWSLDPSLLRLLRKHSGFFKYDLKLYTSDGSLISHIATAVPGFNYCWQIPETLPPGDYKIEISATDSYFKGESEVFTIRTFNW